VTLQPGVVAVTAGPGVTDAVTGIANAMYASSPMLVLSGKNPMHESSAQVTDGVLCRDENDPEHFYLIAEWKDKAEHRALRERIMQDIRPEFMRLVEGDFVPTYADVVA